MTNILLLSVGTRNKIVQYFRNAFHGQGNVIATDMSQLAPALYEANRYYIVPSIMIKRILSRYLLFVERRKYQGYCL
jgi:carbamoyl-phosphate synthase large subunit